MADDVVPIELRTWRMDRPPSAQELAEARRIAACYRDVFGHDPIWNAGWWCPACSDDTRELRFNFVGAPEACPRCGRALVERWPEEVLLEDFAHALGRPGTVALGMWRGDEPLGAVITMRMGIAEVCAHLRLSARLAGELVAALGEDAEVVMLELAFVHPRFQGRGLASRLYQERDRRLREQLGDAPLCVLRTARTPPTRVYERYLRRGFEVVAEYHDDMDRVLLAGRLSG